MPDTAEMLAAVVRDAKVPAGGKYTTAAVTLPMLWDDLNDMCLSQVLAASGDFLLTTVDVPLTPGRFAYPLPARAVRVKELILVRPSVRDAPLVETDSTSALDFSSLNTHWYLQDNAVVPLLATGQTGTLRFRYYRLPSPLVLPSACWRLATKAANVGGQAVWTFTCPGTVAPAAPARFDVVRGTQPFASAGDDLVLSDYSPAASGLNLTLTFPLGAVLPYWDVGDWLCPVNTAPFAQVPVVFHGFLVTSVAARVLREQRDFPGAEAGTASAARKLQMALATVSPRSKAAHAIVNTTWFPDT